jgi:purine-nucleoside phosphorylase
MTTVTASFPVTGIILGSGWPLPAGFVAQQTLPLSTIWPSTEPQTEIPGHAGLIHVGQLTDTQHPVIVLAGRRHLYQGYTAYQVTAGVRWLAQQGVTHLLLTNAAGAITPSMQPGSLMLITDQLNLTGQNPLTATQPGQHVSFTDTQAMYTPAWWQTVTHNISTSLAMHHGVYAGLSGPSYETPAEIRMLGHLGANAVGMSTVLEALQAKALGLSLLGVSCISNLGAGLSATPLTHSDVLDQLQQQTQALASWLSQAVTLCPSHN